VKKYRELIWERILVLAENKIYKKYIIKNLNNYGHNCRKESIPVLDFDLEHIKKIMENYFPKNELQSSLVAENICNTVAFAKKECELFWGDYLTNELYLIYDLLKCSEWNPAVREVENHLNIKKEKIEIFLGTCSEEKIKLILDIATAAETAYNHTKHEMQMGLTFFFDAVFKYDKEKFIKSIEYYLENNTPCNLLPNSLIEKLLSILDDNRVLELIQKYDYDQRNQWVYVFYCELPKEKITKKHVEGLYEFLNDRSDKDISDIPYRNTDFLEKYAKLDKDIFINACRILLSKKEYSIHMVSIYFTKLFNTTLYAPTEVIKKFNKNLYLLKDIYFTLLPYSDIFDYERVFLKELYLADKTILDKYIQFLFKCTYSHTEDRNCCFFDLSDYEQIYDQIFCELVKQNTQKIIIVHFLETLLVPRSNESATETKKDRLIRKWISAYSKDKEKMECLFSVLAKLDANTRKKYFELFIKVNPDFDDFLNLPLTPMSWGGMGSEIPRYQGWLRLLESLLPSLAGVNFIKHKQYIEKQIQNMKKTIENEEIYEFENL
jgi:hypothetical protein